MRQGSYWTKRLVWLQSDCVMHFIFRSFHEHQQIYLHTNLVQRAGKDCFTDMSVNIYIYMSFYTVFSYIFFSWKNSIDELIDKEGTTVT